jgi:hypothetical protein
MDKIHAGYKVTIRDKEGREEIELTLMQYDNGQHKLFNIEDGNRHFDDTFSTHPNELGIYVNEIEEVLNSHDYELIGLRRG